MSVQEQITAADHAPAVVVFGLDDKRKPHASSFAAEEAALAEKAAALMGMRLLTVTTDAERALAARVPRGKIFASGKGFVPFVKTPLFAELEGACTAGALPAKPRSAVTIPADVKESGTASKSSPARQPSGWGEIALGAIVLTLSSPDHAEWYEAQVTGIRGDRFTLRFCDFPKRPPVERSRKELGLLHPEHEPAPPLEI